MEHTLDKTIDSILSQGGLLGALLIVALTVIGLLWRNQLKMSLSYETKLDEVHQERIAELRGIISTQEKSTTAINALSLSIDTRTGAFIDLSGNVALLAQSMKASQESLRDQIERIERTLERERR